MEIKAVAALLYQVFEIGLDFTLTAHLSVDQPHPKGSTATPGDDWLPATPGDWLPYRPSVWL